MSTQSNRDDDFWGTHKPLVSIVVACYAVRQYLPAFISSLEGQGIDASQYELIFVIDGCPEDSGEVISEWMPRSPFPVRLVEKLNGGVASARNLGFDLARGKWITSPDPDDVLDANYFAELERAFSEYPLQRMFVTRMQRASLEGKLLAHPLDFKFNDEKTRKVDLNETPEQIHLSGGTAVWLKSAIEANELQFDELLRTGSDTDFNLKYLIYIGAEYVVVPGSVYWYVSRGDGTSIIDRAANNYSRYVLTLGRSQPAILDLAGNVCPQWLANSLLYAVFHLFRGNMRSNSPVYDLPQEQRQAISDALRSNLQRIGAESIRAFNVVALPYEIRLAWLGAVEAIRRTPLLIRKKLPHRRSVVLGFFASTSEAEIIVQADTSVLRIIEHRSRSVEFLGEHWVFEHLVEVETEGNDEAIKLSLRSPGTDFELSGKALYASSARKRFDLDPPAARVGSSLSAPWIVEAPQESQVAEEQPRPLPDVGVNDVKNTWLFDCSDPRAVNSRTTAEAAIKHGHKVVWARDEDVAPPHTPQASELSVVRGSSAHNELIAQAAVIVTDNESWPSKNRQHQTAQRHEQTRVLLPEQTSLWPRYRSLKFSEFDCIMTTSQHELESLTASDLPYEVSLSSVMSFPLPRAQRLSELRRERRGAKSLLIAPAVRRFEIRGETSTSEQWQAIVDCPQVREWATASGLSLMIVLPEDPDGLFSGLIVPDDVKIVPAVDQLEALASSAIVLTDYSPMGVEASNAQIPVVWFQFDRSSPERASLLSLPGSIDFESLSSSTVITERDQLIRALESARVKNQVPVSQLEDEEVSIGQRIVEFIESSRNPAKIVARVDHATSTRMIIRADSDEPATLHTIRSLLSHDNAQYVQHVDVVGAGFSDRFMSELHAEISQHRSTIAVQDPSTPVSAMLRNSTAPWVGVISSGIAISDDAMSLFATHVSTHQDLKIVAVPPAPRDHPVVSRILDAECTSGVWALTSKFALFRAELMTQSATIGELLDVALPYVTLSSLLEHSSRMGVLKGLAERVPSTGWRTQDDRRSLALARLQKLEALAPMNADPLRESLMIHQLLRIIRGTAEDDWADPDAFGSFRTRIAHLVDSVPPERLISSEWAETRSSRYALTSAGGLRAPWAVDPQPGRNRLLFRGVGVARITPLDITFTGFNMSQESVQIDVVFHRFNVSEVDVFFENDNGSVVEPTRRIDLWEGVGRTYGKARLAPGSFRQFVLPITQDRTQWTVKIRNNATGETVPAKSVYQGPRSVFKDARAYMQMLRPAGTVRLITPDTFSIERHRISQMRYNIATYRRLAREGVRQPERLTVKKHKDIILITDRPKFGDDNGESLFRHIRANRPDLRDRTWLVLDKSAPSFPELSKTGRVVPPGSPLHRKLYLNTQILFSSHISESYNNPYFDIPLAGYRDVTDFTFVWLQHGITKDHVGSAFNRVKRGLDGVVVATEHEQRYALSDDFAHSSDSVMSTGFPRFDLLRDTSGTGQRSIIYMPTWRSWLTGARRTDGTSERIEHFDRQNYFTHQQQFLTHPDLADALERNDVQLRMVLHPAMNAYSEDYEALQSDRITVHRPGSVAYAEAIASGSAMITDYSSVFFDFAYLGKPVIFDHSDDAEYRLRHYSHGLFDYSSSAPGPIVHSVEQLVLATVDLIDSRFEPDPQYSQRLDSVFLFRDRANSERVLERALDIDTQRRRSAEAR